MFGTNARDNILFAVTSYAHICSLFIKHLSLKIGFSHTIFSFSAKFSFSRKILCASFCISPLCSPFSAAVRRKISPTYGLFCFLHGFAFLLFKRFCFFVCFKVLLFTRSCTKRAKQGVSFQYTTVRIGWHICC